MQVRGFTLIEVLLAIAITTIVGAATTSLVFQFTETRQRTAGALTQLEQWQRLSTILRQDVRAYTPARAVRQEEGTLAPALHLSSTPELSFTRLGWRQPVHAAPVRSSLQRVRYRLEAWQGAECTALRQHHEPDRASAENTDLSCLTRQWTWQLDSLRTADWQSQALAGPLTGLELGVVLLSGQGDTTRVKTWQEPLTTHGENGKNSEGRAVLLELTLIPAQSRENGSLHLQVPLKTGPGDRGSNQEDLT